jgi:alkylation response protein AidB-like acyl-CoA dehydrogenase
MNLELAPQEQAFRTQVQAFLADHLPRALADKVLLGKQLDKDDIVAWQRILHAHGWGAPSWPRQFGGTGWSPVEQHIFDEECAAAGAPPQLPFGLAMVGPVIMAFGTEAQQERFLPRIKSGDDWWCQGYSEPGAGSDLASLQMRAERRGDHYVVNGIKTWTTLAQHADWIFCLVRTTSDGPPQAGISFLLIDMRSAGIRVRPIALIDGEPEVNEVSFADVVVPLDHRVGAENQGWTYAKYLLRHERTGIAAVGRCKRELDRLKRIAMAQRAHGRPLFDDSRFRDRIAQLEIDLTALELTCLRVLAADSRQRGSGPEASLLKICGTQIQQRLSELMMEAAGHHALVQAADGSLAARYFNDRKVTIYGGTNEIQRNIIAQMILGL